MLIITSIPTVSVVNADLLLNLTIYKKRPHISIFKQPQFNKYNRKLLTHRNSKKDYVLKSSNQ